MVKRLRRCCQQPKSDENGSGVAAFCDFQGGPRRDPSNQSYQTSGLAAVAPEALLRYRACGGGLDPLGDVRGCGGRGDEEGYRGPAWSRRPRRAGGRDRIGDPPQKQRDANLGSITGMLTLGASRGKSSKHAANEPLLPAVRVADGGLNGEREPRGRTAPASKRRPALKEPPRPVPSPCARRHSPNAPAKAVETTTVTEPT
jgi:hypothetical protein